MPVTIRLRRVGRKRQPSYRVVVTDSSRPRDGQYLETVGFYNPRSHPAELRLDMERVESWVEQGAALSETVASLVRKARRGGDRKVAFIRPEQAAAAAAPAPVAPAGPELKPTSGPKETTAREEAEAASQPTPDTPEQPVPPEQTASGEPEQAAPGESPAE